VWNERSLKVGEEVWRARVSLDEEMMNGCLSILQIHVDTPWLALYIDHENTEWHKATRVTTIAKGGDDPE
jgi:hypothetical protein